MLILIQDFFRVPQLSEIHEEKCLDSWVFFFHCWFSCTVLYMRLQMYTCLQAVQQEITVSQQTVRVRNSQERRTPSHSEILSHSLLLIWDWIWELSNSQGIREPMMQTFSQTMPIWLQGSVSISIQVGLNTIWIWGIGLELENWRSHERRVTEVKHSIPTTPTQMILLSSMESSSWYWKVFWWEWITKTRTGWSIRLHKYSIQRLILQTLLPFQSVIVLEE